MTSSKPSQTEEDKYNWRPQYSAAVAQCTNSVHLRFDPNITHCLFTLCVL